MCTLVIDPQVPGPPQSYFVTLLHLLSPSMDGFPPALADYMDSVLRCMCSGDRCLRAHARQRLASLLAAHLGNFGFRWHWAAWSRTLCTGVEEGNRFLAGSERGQIFVSQILEKLCELGVQDGIGAALPMPLQGCLPPPCAPVNTYLEGGKGQIGRAHV